MSRIVILGGPKCGKTTLANAVRDRTPGLLVRRSDDLVARLDWSARSAHIATEWLGQPGPWICEGVAMARGLRKWLRANRDGRPCDHVAHSHTPMVHLTAGQHVMLRGCLTVFSEILPELVERGVDLRDFGPDE
jgi:hypothetical protein